MSGKYYINGITTGYRDKSNLSSSKCLTSYPLQTRPGSLAEAFPGPLSVYLYAVQRIIEYQCVLIPKRG